MADFPDFTIPKWDIKDWASAERKFKNFFFHDYDIDPGIYVDMSYAPTSPRHVYYLVDIVPSCTIRGDFYVSLKGITLIFKGRLEPYTSFSKQMIIPFPILYGQEIFLRFTNCDIVKGDFSCFFSGWEEKIF